MKRGIILLVFVGLIALICWGFWTEGYKYGYAAGGEAGFATARKLYYPDYTSIKTTGWNKPPINSVVINSAGEVIIYSDNLTIKRIEK